MPFWDWWRSWRFITNHSVLLFLIVASKWQQAFVFYFLPGLHLFLLVLSLLASVTFLLLAGAGRDALEFIFRWALGWFLEQNFTVCGRVIACGRDEDASSAQRGGLRRPFFLLLMSRWRVSNLQRDQHFKYIIDISNQPQTSFALNLNMERAKLITTQWLTSHVKLNGEKKKKNWVTCQTP